MTKPRFANAPSWATDRATDRDGILYTCALETITVTDTTSATANQITVTFGLFEFHTIEGNVESTQVEWRAATSLELNSLLPDDALRFAQALQRSAQALEHHKDAALAAR